MKIVNLTPHAVNFVNSDNVVVRTIGASGVVARVSTATKTIDSIDDIPVTITEFGTIENLPEPATDRIFIVSSLVAQRCTDRQDVFIPNESVRDTQGRIIGCRSLGRI